MIESQLVRTLPAATLPKLPVIRLAQRSVAAFGIKLTGAGIALALQIALARVLGQSGYGEYAYVFAWLQLLLLFSQGGLSIAAVRYVAEYRARQQPDLVHGFIRRSTQMATATSVLLAGLMCAAALAVQQTNPVGGRNLLIAAMALPALAQFALNGAVIRGLGRALLGMLSQLSYPFVFLLSLLVASFLFRNHLTPSDALVLNLGAAVCALGVTVGLRRSLDRELNQPAIPAYRTGQWLTTATEMLVVSGLTYIQVRTGVIFSSWFLDPGATGTYAAIERIADSALLGLVSVELLIAPKFAELYARGHRQELERYARLAAWGSSLVTFAVAGAIILFGESILEMFGEKFVVGYPALLVMLLGVVMRAVCGSVGLLLCMTGYQRDTIIAAAVTLVLSFALSLMLIPRYGILGTATSFTCSMAAWCLSMLFISRWRLGIWGCIGYVSFENVRSLSK